MKILRWLSVFVFWLGTISAHAATPLPVAQPEAVGLSAERVARIGAFIERLQTEHKIAGAVTAVARKGKLVRLEAQGFADVTGGRAMRADDIFAIASMTKPIATVGALMLLEEQKILLSDPVEKYLPEFKDTKVAIAKSDAAGGYVTVAAERKITLHDLLTHRAGMPSGDGPAGALLRERMRALPADAVLADQVKAIAGVPLNNQPGAVWRYSSSLDVMGRVIEVVSGQTLDVFLGERIFAPLGMHDTGFTVPPEKQARLARIYSGSGAQLAKAGSQPDTARKMFSAGGGLFSTAADYVRFCQMLVNGGELDGRRLLSRKSIELMTARHVDSIPLPFLAGQHFGLSVAVQKNDGDSGLLSSPGTYGWSGAYNTYFRIDPKEQLVLVLMVQQTPANNLEIQYGFQNTVMQAITD